MADDWKAERMVAMIAVVPVAQPSDFHEKVGKIGNAFLAQHGIPPDRHCIASFWKGKDFWRKSLTDLHRAYDGICAYLGIYLELEPGGAVTIDHFLDKSDHPSLAYQWTNFRLASRRANSRKKDHKDVIDPFLLPKYAYFLEPTTGRIFPNPELIEHIPELQKTIDRLKLDGKAARGMRLKRINAVLSQDWSEEWLRQDAPFIYAELKRQSLL